MKKASSDVRFLMITSALVALLGLRALVDLSSDEAPSYRAAAVDLNPSSRQPASLEKTAHAPTTISLRDPLVQWDCGGKSKDVLSTVRGQQMRLKGKGCGKDFVAERLQIVNETNGFTASIFLRHDANYETDLIQLREGPNRIRVRYQNASGLMTDSVLNVTSSSN